jgi:hypothetical protein
MIAEHFRQQAMAAPRPAPTPSPSHCNPSPRIAAPRRRSGVGRLLFMLVLIGVPLALSFYSSGILALLPAAGEYLQTPEHLLFDTNASRALPITIGGKPAIIGRTRTVLDEDKLFVDAYAAADAKRLWRIGPLGTYSENYQHAHFGAVDNRLVVTDATSVHVHDLATGQRLKSHSLTDRVNSLCVPPPTEKTRKIWLEQVDEQHRLLDIETMELTESPRPTWCPERHWNAARTPPFAILPEQVPTFDGFQLRQAYRDGDIAVASGVKHPGTAIPRAIGFDPRTQKVRWQQEFASDPTRVRAGSAEHAALASGRFITVYGTGTEAWHATSFDAKTGTRQWDITLREIFSIDHVNGLEATDQHVFVLRTSSLEIYGASDGRLLGTVGRETYD